jgi:hypothetical protein
MQRTFKLTGITPAGGAQVIDMAGYARVRNHQVHVTSVSSSAGTIAVAVRTPGTDEYVTVETKNLSAGSLAFAVDYYCDAMQFTPASDNAAKDFDVAVFCLQG